jgi:glycosyltransferase involved in cell wall biosynthesis
MIAIVNSGTQPELRHLAKSFQDSQISFKYFTSSSIGTDWIWGKIGHLLNSRKWMEIFLGRRTLPISEANISRSLFFFSLCIRVMPQKFRGSAFGIRNRIHLFLVFLIIASGGFSIIIFQDHIPWYWCILKKRMKFVLLLSNATPHYVISVMETESKSEAFSIRYFGRSLPRQRELRSFERSCFLANRVVVPSFFVKSTFKGFLQSVYENKVDVIRLGFDPKLFNHSEFGGARIERVSTVQPFHIVFVGQICGRKGVGYLAQAFQDADLPSGSTLTLVGTSINGFAEYILSHFSNIQHIEFTNQWELSQLYRNKDLFVMPSLIEGFCLSAIEAMASGIAVLVTPETIDNIQINQVDGLTALSADVKSLQIQLEWASQNPLRMIQIARKGALRVREFTWNSYGEKFKAHLLQLEKVIDDSYS